MVIFMTEWVDSDVLNWVGMLRFRHKVLKINDMCNFLSINNIQI
jgi:hypothetical protein